MEKLDIGFTFMGEAIGEDLAVTASAADISVHSAIYTESDDSYPRYKMVQRLFYNRFIKNTKVTLPAGTPARCIMSCHKPDVFVLVAHMPEHENADQHGTVTIVLRNASYKKYRDNQRAARRAAREAERQAEAQEAEAAK